jgi:hypothetical protein
MKAFKQLLFVAMTLFSLITLSACAPEVGSEKWCENMNDKPKADWSMNEAADYTKHCLLK